MKKTHWKFLLDIVMMLLMLVLMKLTFTGIMWHELIGLGIFLLFAVHKAINYKTIVCFIKNFSKKDIGFKVKIMSLLDIVLFVDVAMMTFSGIMISREVFGLAQTNENLAFWSALHHSMSYLALILISIHVGLHWAEIMCRVKKGLAIQRIGKVAAAALRIGAVAIMVLGVKASATQDVLAKIAEPIMPRADKEESLMAAVDTLETDQANYDVAQGVSAEGLEEYLSGMICTACGMHCPLSAPQCAIGRTQAQQATEQYYELLQSGATSQEIEENRANTVSDNTAAKGKGKGRGRLKNHETVQLPLTNDQELTKHNENKNMDKPDPIAQAADYIAIMGLYIGGTYYLAKIPKKLL